MNFSAVCWLGVSLSLHLLLLVWIAESGQGMGGAVQAETAVCVQLLEPPITQSVQPLEDSARHQAVAKTAPMTPAPVTAVSASLTSVDMSVSALGISGPRAAAPVAVEAFAVTQTEQGGDEVGTSGGRSGISAAPLASGNARPDYPWDARQRGWEGEVLLWVVVSPRGEVVACGIETSSGYESLDRSALNAVQRWRFSPASLDGFFVESRVLVPVVFRLQRS